MAVNAALKVDTNTLKTVEDRLFTLVRECDFTQRPARLFRDKDKD